MKKIILIIFFVFSFIVSSPMDNTTRYDITNTYNKASELLGINNENVMILNLPIHYRLNGQDVSGVTLFYKSSNTYIIYIKKGLHISAAIKTLVHELIHVWQLKSGKLIHIGNNTVLWQGWMTIDIEDNRIDNPWEREAYELTPKVIKIIK